MPDADAPEPTAGALTRTDGGVAGAAVLLIGAAAYVALNSKSNVAALLAFSAAIFVALLTAYWTQRRLSQELAAADRRQAAQLQAETERQAQTLEEERQRQAQQLQAENERLRVQLAHERERHIQRLEAESARLKLQLAHERQLHDLAELRKVVDDAMSKEEAARAFWQGLRRVTLREPYDKPLADQAYSHLQHAREALSNSTMRLSVRGQQSLANALWDSYRAMKVPDLSPTHSDRDLVRKTWEEVMNDLADKHSTFIVLAQTAVASVLPGQ
jgi:hypothetical protein